VQTDRLAQRPHPAYASKVTVTGAWSDQREGWSTARSTAAVLANLARPGVAISPWLVLVAGAPRVDERRLP